jgi:glyoxylase I family protein
MGMNIKGIHHVELTVTNLEVSRTFYQEILGFKVVAEYPGFIMFSVSNFYLGITDHKGKSPKDRFDEFRTGLDHVSFEVSTSKDLDEAIRFFDKNNISHGKIEKLSNDVLVLVFRDPDNIQLELAYKENG